MREFEPISPKLQQQPVISCNTTPSLTLENELNKLKLIRRLERSQVEEDLEKYIDKLKQKEDDDLDIVMNNVSKITREEEQGATKTWKECLLDELKLHKSNCSCTQFAENARGLRDDGIVGLVRYIRNKLTHFEDDKEKYGDRWMATQADILNFIAAAVPELLPAMYNAMMKTSKEYFEGDARLESDILLPF